MRIKLLIVMLSLLAAPLTRGHEWGAWGNQGTVNSGQSTVILIIYDSGNDVLKGGFEI